MNEWNEDEGAYDLCVHCNDYPCRCLLDEEENEDLSVIPEDE